MSNCKYCDESSAMAARFGKQLAEVRELFGIGIHKLNKAEAERDQALADVEKLVKGLAEARAVLREVEWCIFNANDRQIICPICWSLRDVSHQDGCRLAKAMGEQ